jgi:signal peptidase I
MLGQHWVDDLAVECLADVTSSEGELSLLLVRGGNKVICRINLADGKATLSITKQGGGTLSFTADDGKSAASPTAQTSVKGKGSYRLRLSNCDHELLLWVNGSVVRFDGPTTYDFGAEDDLVAPFYSAADPGDLAPAGVAAKGAAVKLSGLRIYRDKYYIATTTGGTDYDRPLDPARIHEVFQDPSQWESSGLFAPDNRGSEDFELKEDQFLPLGDNSPQSYDARYWFSSYNEHHYVERDLLIGKALLIYWPHTWNRPIPFTPNFSKMGPIR